MIKFSTYFNDWLYGQDGYYSNYKQIGKDGDFFTSVSTSSFFGGSIAKKIISSIEDGFLPNNTTILEIGAHHGYLLADIIQFIYTLKPQLLQTLNFAIVERFKNLQEQQKKYIHDSFGDIIKLKHYDDISEVKLENAYIIANEILDAFACDLVYTNKDEILQQAVVSNHKIEFSAQESEQSNCAISITLPQGWKFQEKTKKSDTEHEPLMLAGLNPLYTVYDIYDSDHTLIGAIGYSNYEPYEGDKDSVQVVYSALRLGSVYRFDTDSRYDVVKTNKYGTTALTTVVYQDGANAEPVNNWGILSYNNEKECFVAVELESNSVSESQVLEIAKSIEF